MRRVMTRTSLLMPVAALLAVGWVRSAGGQAPALQMQPVEAYLMDEAYEVALARSAAPAKVSGPAAVLVLRRDGYHEAHAGRNGFVCLVERSWSSPIGEHQDFFNPGLRAPICYNAEAARTILRDYLLRTELALAGGSISEIKDAVDQAIASGNVPAPVRVAMSFMMSGGQLLGTSTGRFVPHVMFYVPYATNESLGHTAGTECHACLFEHAGGPLAAIVVPVPELIDPPKPEGGVPGS